jgi:DinB superfamily
MTKDEILVAAENSFNRFTQTCHAIDEPVFFDKPGEKWSVAENIQHLIISTNTTTLAYSLPKFLVRWVGGTPNRASRSFEELAAKYYKKLVEGGQASGRYIPKPIAIKYGKEKLLSNWTRATEKFMSALRRNRSEKDLDAYLAGHPLLGRITLRELCYFTIFHTDHHLQGIEKRINPAK